MDDDVVLRAGRNRVLQKRRIPGGWTKARRIRFLDHLAATCNVRAAVETVGLSMSSLYAMRRRDDAFAEEWRMALLAGYDRLEGELLRKAIAVLNDDVIGDPDHVVTGPVSVEQAIKLLDRHHAMRKKDGPPDRHQSFRATQAETDAMLMKRIRALRLQREATA